MSNPKDIQQAKLEMVKRAIEQVRAMSSDASKRKKPLKPQQAEGNDSGDATVAYECDSSTPLDSRIVDGMKGFIEDEPTTGLEWDISCENPPFVDENFDMSTLPHPDKPRPKSFNDFIKGDKE